MGSLLGLGLWYAGIGAQAGGSLPAGTFAGTCADWTPVNDGAFGMGTGADSDYRNEEGFEVIVFNDQLYMGMEADNMCIKEKLAR